MRIPGAKLLKTRLFKRYSQKVGLPPGTLLYVGEERTEPVRITVLDYNETRLQEEDVQTIQECLHFRSTETVTWIHIKGVHKTEIILKPKDETSLPPQSLYTQQLHERP